MARSAGADTEGLPASGCPCRSFSSTHHLEKLAAFEVSASPRLSEVGTDLHAQNAAESCFTTEPLCKILSLFLVSTKYVSAGRARKSRTIPAEMGAGVETQVWLWSRQKCDRVFAEYCMASGQCRATRALCPCQVQLPLKTVHLSVCHEENKALESL